MKHPFVWLELHTGDLDRARSFYTDLFGWKLESMPGEVPYIVIQGDSGGIGGMTALPTMAHPAPHWLPYVGVENLEVATQRARELGAKVQEENVPVPGMGRFTILTDPTGAEIALWEQHASAGS